MLNLNHLFLWKIRNNVVLSQEYLKFKIVKQ